MSDLEDDLRDALDRLYEKDREIESLKRQLKERDGAFEELDGIWRRRIAEATDEIKRLKKFDVKFSENYDDNLQPVGARYDLLEWQAKLQTEFGLLRVRHAQLRRELDEARGMRMKAEFERDHSDTQRGIPCMFGGTICLDDRHDWFTAEQWIEAAKKD